jgi:hypothetical protein
VAREHYLILREEEGDEEPMPDNPAWNALVEWHALQDKVAREEEK